MEEELERKSHGFNEKCLCCNKGGRRLIVCRSSKLISGAVFCGKCSSAGRAMPKAGRWRAQQRKYYSNIYSSLEHILCERSGGRSEQQRLYFINCLQPIISRSCEACLSASLASRSGVRFPICWNCEVRGQCRAEGDWIWI